MSNQELIKALVKTQLEIEPPKKDKINTRFKTATNPGSEYCSLDSIYAAVRAPMAKNGLTLSHSIETVEGKTLLVTTLYHISGEFIWNKLPMFIEKADSQGFAAALTYARRYAICSLLGLPSDDDDDGNLATDQQSKPEFVGLNPSQINSIIDLLNGDDQLGKGILAAYKVSDFRAIPGKEFQIIVKNLNQIQDSRGEK